MHRQARGHWFEPSIAHWQAWESRVSARTRGFAIWALEALSACLLIVSRQYGILYSMSTDMATTVTVTPDELRALRRSLSLTQGQLAARLALSREAITSWETGRSGPRGPSVILLRQLQAEAELNAPTSGVISGKIENSPSSPVDAT